MNKFMGIGRITDFPELKVTQNNKNVCTFTIAINRIGAQSHEQQADFINCIAFGKVAETIVTYTQKGFQIGVEGRLAIDNVDTQNGKRYYTKIVVEKITLLQNKESKQQNVQTSYVPHAEIQQSYLQNAQSTMNQEFSISPSAMETQISDDSDLPF